MLPLHRRLPLIIKSAGGQSWIDICLGSSLIYQVSHAMYHRNSILQISLLRLCAVKFSYLSDTSAFWRNLALFAATRIFNLNFMSGSLPLLFGPMMMYKWFIGNADRSSHIFNLYVSTWLLIILVTHRIDWLLSILTVKGSQYHFR
jgi:hypothetical protein